MFRLLTNHQMRAVDELTIKSGTKSFELMRAAGQAVARQALEMLKGHRKDRVIILCGPGNNGGDGFVAGHFLENQGLQVRLYLLGHLEDLKGDAAEAARIYKGKVHSFQKHKFEEASLIIDTLFGSGLARPITGTAEQIILEANRSGAPILSVDIPSGVDGDTGEVRGRAIEAERTITFFRYKPGHFLYPGRKNCGQLTCTDIGINEMVLDEIDIATNLNHPEFWKDSFRTPAYDDHKYKRGHAAIVSGPAHSTGAARLAARAALRVGAGLVSVMSPQDAADINAAQLTAIMVKSFDQDEDFIKLFDDVRLNSVLIGPGCGVGAQTRKQVLDLLRTKRHLVLDADTLTSFEDDRDLLFDAIQSHEGEVVLTPHSGEFQRLFGESVCSDNKLELAKEGANRSGAILISKGPDTVIAAPDGKTAIDYYGTPLLATAGSGDVLAGLVCGLMAQSMPAFEAACCAVYLHDKAARAFGPGLIAEDLPEQIPSVLRTLLVDIKKATVNVTPDCHQ